MRVYCSRRPESEEKKAIFRNQTESPGPVVARRCMTALVAHTSWNVVDHGHQTWGIGDNRPIENVRDNYFFEKSLKHSRNLFCKRVGGDSSEPASGLRSSQPLPLFLSYRGDKNTVAISMGPRFTVVPAKAGGNMFWKHDNTHEQRRRKSIVTNASLKHHL